MNPYPPLTPEELARQLANEGANVAVLVEAGSKLANEVDALTAFEPQIRAEIGNTNYAILIQRLAELRAALSSVEGGR